jgi:hypothetical protein
LTKNRDAQRIDLVIDVPVKRCANTHYFFCGALKGVQKHHQNIFAKSPCRKLLTKKSPNDKIENYFGIKIENLVFYFENRKTKF